MNENTTITPLNSKEMEDLFTMNEVETVNNPADTKLNFKQNSLNEDDLNIGGNKSDEEIEEKKVDEKKVEVVSDADITIANTEKIEETTVDSEKDLELAALEELVKKDKLFLFEGGEFDKKELKDYTKKERAELIEANQERIKEEAEAKAPVEFFESLSPLMQMAFNYETNGGTDLKGLFANLADFQTVSNLDITTESGQEEVVKTYLKMQGDLNDQEIQEELSNIKDIAGALEKKAGLYKPKIEAKQQQIIDKKLKDQEAAKVRQDAAMVKYKEAVYNTIASGEINGVKLTKTTQGKLYEGLTTRVGIFNEFFKQIPGFKADYSHMAEIYWLAVDRKGYLEALGAVKSAETAADDFKRLKTAGQNKTTANTTVIDHTTPVKQNTIKKKTNLFART